ncbi:MAG: DUF4405 domain-containing protein [Bdellovibrionaceae bacterium]|nr:DUF4405 domain-containing protein [Pseudobdellovibrionaceae bacterium]
MAQYPPAHEKSHQPPPQPRPLPGLLLDARHRHHPGIPPCPTAPGDAPPSWGLGRHEWGEWHYNLALLFLILIIWHLWMNRLWLYKIAGAMKSWRILLGLLAGAALVVTMALLPVSSRQGGHGGGGRQQSQSQQSAP